MPGRTALARNAQSLSIMRVGISRDDRDSLTVFVCRVGKILCRKRLIAEVLEFFCLLALFLCLRRKRCRDGEEQKDECKQFEGAKFDHCAITVRSSPFLG